MTGYSWHVGTLIDGKITNEIPVTGYSWQKVMDDAGTLSVTAALSDPVVRKLNLRTSAEVARCFLAVAYTDSDGTETFIDGGPIWTHSYDATSKQLTIRAAGMWSLFDHRFILPVLTSGVNPATVTTSYSALSLGTIAKRLLQLAATHTGGSVPVVFPVDEAGSNARDYTGFSMTAIGAELRNLSSAQGGPEIQFVPRRTAADGRLLEWVMGAGTTEQPLLSQTGADWVWDLAAVSSSASGLQVTRDGSVMADRVWAQGSGTDISTLFGRADDTGLIAAGIPLMETVDSAHTDSAVQTDLNGYAAADLAQARRPQETWTVTVQRDETPTVGSYQVGHWVSLNTEGDEYIPDGTYRSRITSISGDTTNQVKVALMPTLGSI